MKHMAPSRHQVNDKDGMAGFKEEMMNPNISVRAPRDMMAIKLVGRVLYQSCQFWDGLQWLHLDVAGFSSQFFVLLEFVHRNSLAKKWTNFLVAVVTIPGEDGNQPMDLWHNPHFQRPR